MSERRPDGMTPPRGAPPSPSCPRHYHHRWSNAQRR